MPTRRRPISRRPGAGAGLEEWQTRLLLEGDGRLDADERERWGDSEALLWVDDDRRAAWEEIRHDVLEAWVATRPGTRPWAWWAFDAPRVARGREHACVARLRLGGGGIAKRDAAAVMDDGEFGVPALWVDGTLDPDDPPVFESQAAYLERHGLLMPGERERLRRSDLEPEALSIGPGASR
jgi:hypothetical protein